MLDKEFVPYAESYELKELGFDEPCIAYYHNHVEYSFVNDLHRGNTTKNSEQNLYSSDCSAPTFSQAFRWFRKKYNTHSFIIPLVDEVGFVYEYQARIHIEEYSVEIIGNFEICEEAELFCLSKLIEIVKNKQDVT